MFAHRRFGELQEDIEYTRQYLEQDLAYAKAMINEAISEDEKDRWRGAISQISTQLSQVESSSGTVSLSTLSTTGLEPEVISTTPITAGFDLSSLLSSSNWPILAIIAAGSLLIFKGRKKPVIRRRKRRSVMSRKSKRVKRTKKRTRRR